MNLCYLERKACHLITMAYHVVFMQVFYMYKRTVLSNLALLYMRVLNQGDVLILFFQKRARWSFLQFNICA